MGIVAYTIPIVNNQQVNSYVIHKETSINRSCSRIGGFGFCRWCRSWHHGSSWFLHSFNSIGRHGRQTKYMALTMRG